MATENLAIVITAQDHASAVFRDLGQQTRSFVSNLTTGLAQGAGMAAFNQAAQLAGEAFHFATEAVIGFNSSLEQSRIAWATMLGGAAQANAMLANLQQFAATTPFEFPDVERAGKRLLAMGFAARDIIPLLTDVGNAASALGVGVEGIDRITLALGQMSNRTKVTAQDMLQLTEVGIPAWRILAQAMGTSIAQVQDAAEKGVIPAQTFINAFQQFARTNYGGLMDQQSRTFGGAMSNIRDQLRIVGASAFQPLFEALSRLAQQFATFTTSDAVRDFGNGFRNASIAFLAFLDVAARAGPVLELLKAGLIGVAGAMTIALLPAVISVTRALAGMAISLALALGPWALLAAAIAAAAVVVMANWDQLATAADQATAAISEKWAGLIEWFSGTFAPAVSGLAGSLWEGFANPAIEALNAVSDAWTTFWNQDIGGTGQTAFQQLSEQAATGWENFKDAAVEALVSVIEMWNQFVTAIGDIGRAGVPLLGLWGAIADKTIDVTKAADDVKTALNAIPGVAISAGEHIGQFVSTSLPQALGRTVEFLKAAAGAAGEFAPQLQARIAEILADINARMSTGAGDIGGKVGGALANGIANAVKPLAEQLNLLLAKQLATPAQQALEDAQAQLERNKLIIENLRAAPEERSAAIRANIGLERDVLPGLRLAAFDANQQVVPFQRGLDAAQQRFQIEQLRSEIAAQAISVQIPLTVNMQMPDGSTQVIQQLIEANQQAQTPPPVQLSGVRRG